jgi:hypothetical protein
MWSQAHMGSLVSDFAFESNGMATTQSTCLHALMYCFLVLAALHKVYLCKSQTDTHKVEVLERCTRAVEVALVLHFTSDFEVLALGFLG